METILVQGHPQKPLGLRFLAMALEDLNDKVCVELLMGAVFGIAALVGSPTGGEHSTSAVARLAMILQNGTVNKEMGDLKYSAEKKAWQVEFPKFKGK